MTAVEAPRPEAWRLAAWLTLTLLFATVAYVGELTSDNPPDDYAYRYSSSIGAFLVYSIVLGIVLLISYGLDRRSTFGLRRPASWPRALGFAALGLIGVYVLTGLYVTASGTDPSEEQGLVPAEWDSGRIVPFVLFLLSVSVVAPVVEEMTYRGLGFALLAPHGTWTAILTTGILFGLAHGLLEALPILAAFGVVLAWIRARTSSLYPCIVLHGFFNGLAVIVSVAA